MFSQNTKQNTHRRCKRLCKRFGASTNDSASLKTAREGNRDARIVKYWNRLNDTFFFGVQTIQRFVRGSDAAFRQITLTTCYYNYQAASHVRSQFVRPITTDVARSVVCVSVC